MIVCFRKNMEEKFTNCLLNIRRDLSQLKNIRSYINFNAGFDAQHGCSITWKTVETLNSILALCSSQEESQTESLDVLLDSFFLIVTNNDDKSVWSKFGADFGTICLKLLSAIEKTELFEILFCKLLTIVNVLCEHTSDAWKAIARQIFNVFINKTFSFFYFETGLNLFMSILKNINNNELYAFAQQNLHLLKTTFSLIPTLGDYQTQEGVITIVLTHVLRDRKLTQDILIELNPDMKTLISRLTFEEFQEDSTAYLTALNKCLGSKRKVFSINCILISVGGHRLESPSNKKSLWLHANNLSKRFSIKSFGLQSGIIAKNVICISFTDVNEVLLERQSENRFRIVINVINLNKIFRSVRSNEVMCLALLTENSVEDILDFKQYVETSVINKKHLEENDKLSQTCDEILIDKFLIDGNSQTKENPFKEYNSKNKFGISSIIPNALDLLQKVDKNEVQPSENLNFSVNLKSENLINSFYEEKNNVFSCSQEIRTSEQSLLGNSQKMYTGQECETKIVPESQELSPNSFVESLNKNLGIDSPIIKESFEEQLQISDFRLKTSPKISHKLFHHSDTVYELLERNSANLFEATINTEKHTFDQTNIANNGLKKARKSKKTTNKKATNSKIPTHLETIDTQSDKFFRGHSIEERKKPSLPKLKRVANKKKLKPIENSSTSQRHLNRKKYPPKGSVKKEIVSRPSLLDPNSYTFQRWLQPTTSERSNFWLKKLENFQYKCKPGSVFDFTDDTENELKEIKKKKKTVKRKSKNSVTKKVKHTNKEKPRCKKNLKQSNNKENELAKEFLNQKNSKEISNGVETMSPKSNNYLLHIGSYKNEFHENFHITSKSSFNTDENILGRRHSSDESILVENYREATLSVVSNEKSELESRKPSEDAELILPGFEKSPVKKRNRSDEENSLTKSIRKKKSQTNSNFLSSQLQVRLNNIERRVKQETDEILEVISKSCNYLFNRIYQEQAKDVVQYVRKAEKAVLELCKEDFNVKIKRIERVITYYEAGCSVVDVCNFTEIHISEIQGALTDLKKKKDPNQKVINRFNNKLANLIEDKIDMTIKKEISSRKNQLLRLTSVFGLSEDESF